MRMNLTPRELRRSCLENKSAEGQRSRRCKGRVMSNGWGRTGVKGKGGNWVGKAR